MIIHSIVPPENIFPANQDDFSQQMECKWNGIPLLVEQNSHQCKVIRIMSSNPCDYLRNEIQPGSFLYLNEIQL